MRLRAVGKLTENSLRRSRLQDGCVLRYSPRKIWIHVKDECSLCRNLIQMTNRGEKKRDHMEKPNQHRVGSLFLLRQQSAEIVPARRDKPSRRRLLHVMAVQLVQLLNIKNCGGRGYPIQR